MDPKDQLREVNEVLDKLTRFRHFNGWAAIAAGVLATIGFYIINAQFGSYFHSDTYFKQVSQDEAINIVSYFLLLMVITGILSALIVVVKLPKDLTRYGWRNLLRLIGTISLYIVAGGIIVFRMLINDSPPNEPNKAVSSVFIVMLPALMCILYGLSMIHVSLFSDLALKWLGLFILTCGIFGALMVDFSWILWLIAFGVGHIITGIIILRNRAIES